MPLPPTATDPPRSTVLRLHWPAGATIALALAFVAVAAAVCEVAARSEVLAGRLFPESVGSGQPQLDKKLVLLREMVEREGAVDCLFLGSSQAYRALDPEAISARIRARTGQPLRCFNFGLGGMSETSEAPLARILLRKYRPRLVVVGVSSYGMSERGIRFGEFLESSPWYRYQAGRPNLDGWLLEHSYVMRRYQGYLFWTNPEKDAIATQEGLVVGMGASGHAPFERGRFRDVGPENRRVLEQYRISPRHVEALDALFRLRSPEVEFLAVEMPVHESVIALYPHGADDHEAARATIAEVAARHGVPFWRVPDDLALPTSRWADFVHLNRDGTAVYSAWLGERLADAFRSGELRLPQ